MERLTEKGHEYHDCEFMEDCMAQYMNRLREYEDTLLEPSEIKRIVSDIFKLSADTKRVFGDIICEYNEG